MLNFLLKGLRQNKKPNSDLSQGNPAMSLTSSPGSGEVMMALHSTETSLSSSSCGPPDSRRLSLHKHSIQSNRITTIPSYKVSNTSFKSSQRKPRFQIALSLQIS